MSSAGTVHEYSTHDGIKNLLSVFREAMSSAQLTLVEMEPRKTIVVKLETSNRMD